MQRLCGQVSDSAPPCYRNNRCKAAEGSQGASGKEGEGELLVLATEEGQRKGKTPQ